MAPVEGQTSKSFLEGWEKWQIALFVGAPVCLGLAGLWYYNKSTSGPKAGQDPTKPKPKNTDAKSKNNNATAEATPAKPVEETPLTKAQAAKNKGNNFFKEGKYDKAIECYTEALKTCPPENKTEMSTFYANRAAAYDKLKNPQQVVENCTEAIKLNGKYTKALSRRANAAEQIGDLTMSLEDVTAVCILEGFQNQSTLQMADRVLKSLGKQKAKEALKTQKPAMPSRHFVKKYFSDFTQDPVQKCFTQPEPTESRNITNEEGDATNVKDKVVQDGPPQMDNDGPPQMGNPESSGPPQMSDANKEDSQEVEKKISNIETPTEVKMENTEVQSGQMNGTGPDIPKHCPFKTAVDRLKDNTYDEIVTLCNQELDISPPSQYTQLSLLLRGTMYCLMNQPDDAFTDLNTVLATEDLDKKIKVNALIKRGSLKIRKEKQTEGLDDFAHAVRIDPSNPDIYFHRGHENIQLDRLEDAVRDFENSISKNSNFPHAYIQKSYAEHRRAAAEQSTLKLEKAIKSYEETLKKFPNCADGHALYAQALCDLGRFDDADNEFETAIKLEPNNANTLVHRALLKLQWKQTIDEPVGLIKQAIDLDDKCEYAYEILGTIEVQRGDMVNAVKLFQRAISLCRTETEMSHLFSLLHAAQAQLKAAQTLGIPLPSHFSPM